MGRIAAAVRRIGRTTQQHILDWAAGLFDPVLTQATAFGVAGCCPIPILGPDATDPSSETPEPGEALFSSPRR
jgi:hypothetical protein